MTVIVCFVGLFIALRALAWANSGPANSGEELYERRLRDGPMGR